MSVCAVPRGTMPTLTTMRDGGDFCGFIEGDGDRWSAPDNAAVCAAIREMGGVELKPSGRVEAIERVEDGWRVEGKEFEAVVVASHGPSLAATAVAQLTKWLRWSGPRDTRTLYSLWTITRARRTLGWFWSVQTAATCSTFSPTNPLSPRRG